MHLKTHVKSMFACQKTVSLTDFQEHFQFADWKQVKPKKIRFALLLNLSECLENWVWTGSISLQSDFRKCFLTKCVKKHVKPERACQEYATAAYPRTMASLVWSWDTQGLQSHSDANLAQSLWRKRRVAPIRSRSFILLGPYWTADASSLVKKSLWNTGGALLKYLKANLDRQSS